MHGLDQKRLDEVEMMRTRESLLRSKCRRQSAVADFVAQCANMAIDLKILCDMKRRHSLAVTGDSQSAMDEMEKQIVTQFRKTFGHEMIASPPE